MYLFHAKTQFANVATLAFASLGRSLRGADNPSISKSSETKHSSLFMDVPDDGRVDNKSSNSTNSKFSIFFNTLAFIAGGTKGFFCPCIGTELKLMLSIPADCNPVLLDCTFSAASTGRGS